MRSGAGMTGSTAAHIRLLNFRNHINRVSFDFLENTKGSLILNDQQRHENRKSAQCAIHQCKFNTQFRLHMYYIDYVHILWPRYNLYRINHKDFGLD